MVPSRANPRAATRKDKARRLGKVRLILSGNNVDTDVYAQLLSAQPASPLLDAGVVGRGLVEVGIHRANLHPARPQDLDAALADIAAAVPVAVGTIANIHRAFAARVDTHRDVQLVAIGPRNGRITRSIERHRFRLLTRLARRRGVRTNDAVLFRFGDLSLPQHRRGHYGREHSRLDHWMALLDRSGQSVHDPWPPDQRGRRRGPAVNV